MKDQNVKQSIRDNLRKAWHKPNNPPDDLDFLLCTELVQTDKGLRRRGGCINRGDIQDYVCQKVKEALEDCIEMFPCDICQYVNPNGSCDDNSRCYVTIRKCEKEEMIEFYMDRFKDQNFRKD